MKQQIFTSISLEDLENLISRSVSRVIQVPSKKPTDNLDSDFITIQQASEFTNIAIPTLYDYTHKKKIPFHKVGKRLIFSKKELTKWITSKNK